jgi:hypothetical protein
MLLMLLNWVSPLIQQDVAESKPGPVGRQEDIGSGDGGTRFRKQPTCRSVIECLMPEE